jgi:hypothetical protein
VAFKPFKDDRTEDEKIASEVRQLSEEEREKIKERDRNVAFKAWQFYEQWIKEDEHVSESEMQLYFKRAWKAAEIFVDGTESNTQKVE